MLPHTALVRQATALFRGLACMQHDVVCPAAAAAAEAAAAVLRSISSTASDQHVTEQGATNDNQQLEQQRKYRWVYSSSRSTWSVQIGLKILSHDKPASTHQVHRFKSQQAAAAKADLLALPVHGDAAVAHLNFPRTNYSDMMISQQRSSLQAQYPGITLYAPPSRNWARMTDTTGAKAAIAAAEQRAQASFDSSELQNMVLAGVFERAERPGMFRMEIMAAGIGYLSVPLESKLQAACAYDMVRMLLYGQQCSHHFPPSLHESSWLEAMALDVELTRPGRIAAASSLRPPPDYCLVEAGRAADAAVAAEAAAAAAAAVSHVADIDSTWTSVHRSAFGVGVPCVLPGLNMKVRVYRCYSAQLEASVAADLARLAKNQHSENRPARLLHKNLPHHMYTASSVAAMWQWLQLAGRRYVEAQQKKQEQDKQKQEQQQQQRKKNPGCS